jgi:hypothetical protein
VENDDIKRATFDGGPVDMPRAQFLAEARLSIRDLNEMQQAKTSKYRSAEVEQCMRDNSFRDLVVQTSLREMAYNAKTAPPLLLQLCCCFLFAAA